METPSANPPGKHSWPHEARRLGVRLRDAVLEKRSTYVLLVPVAAYTALAGLLLLGTAGVVLAVLIVLLVASFGPRVPADTMLSLYRAEPIAPGQGAALRSAITSLSERAGLRTPPALAVVPSHAVGAFSAGAEPRYALLMTEGLLRRHSVAEITAIAAHEIAHMRAGDLPFFALADTITRLAQVFFYVGVASLGLEVLANLTGEHAVSWLAILVLLAAPTLNSQLQLALPRQREFDADHVAAGLLGDMRAVVDSALSSAPDFGSPIDDVRFPVPQRRAPIPSPARAHISGAIRADRLRSGPLPALMAPLVVTDEPLITLVGVGPIEMKPRDRWPGVWF